MKSVAARKHVVSPWSQIDRDRFLLRDCSGYGVDVYVRGPRVFAERWHGAGWVDCQARDVWQDVFRPTCGRTLEVPCVRYQDGRLTGEVHRYYPTRDPVTGLEWEIIWPDRRSVPACGYVDFDLRQTPGAAWHYQPELRPDERETCYRQDWAVGSYACYSPWSGRYLRRDGEEIVNFETGKLCHLARSFLRDSSGNRVWCKQRIVGRTLRVWLPTRWLDDCEFPVTLGPTFGYTKQGGHSSIGGTYRLSYASLTDPRTAATGDAVTDLSVFSRINTGGNGTAPLAVYDCSGTTPSNQIGTANATVTTTPGWFSASLSVSLSAGTKYVPAFQWDGPDNRAYYWDSVGGTARSYGISDSLPNPWNLSLTDGYAVSVYATYTVASSGFPLQLLFASVRHAKGF